MIESVIVYAYAMSNAAQSLQTPMVPLDDERSVLRRIHHGDRAAFAMLYGWYGTPIYRIVLSRTADRALAEDILKDTFRIAMEKIEAFTLTDRSIYFWLRRIAINLSIDRHRERQREQRILGQSRHDIPSPSADPSPSRGVEIKETTRDVDTSLSRMNPRYAIALRMRLIEGRSRDECALALDISASTFDVLLHRAAKAFRKVYPP